MASLRTTQPIRFGAIATTARGVLVLRLPQAASERLPSRGQVAVAGTAGGHPFETVLEPDGVFGHWMRVDASLQRATALEPGEEVAVVLEVSDEWPEPSVPQDLAAELAGAPPGIQELWRAITPMARWEWVRWVNATRDPATRRRRVEVSISKMQAGKRRPCCFNLAGCTDPELSRNGRLTTA